MNYACYGISNEMDGSNEGAADLGIKNQFIELRSDISGFS